MAESTRAESLPLTRAEAAVELEVTYDRVRRLTERGTLKAYRDGRRIMISRRALEEYKNAPGTEQYTHGAQVSA